MPELPEVQTVVDSLNQQKIAGRTIIAARVNWPKTIAGMSPARFSKKIAGCTIRQVTRRGKYIVFHLSHGLTMLIHLRMTGRLTWTQVDRIRNKHEHVVIKLGSKDELRFQDMRKFGRIWLTATPETILDKLGPEPLAAGFTHARFIEMLRTRKRRMKPLLLDQSFLVGLGNIYVDEALWKAKIHPLRLSNSLTSKEVASLHGAILHVLKKGLKSMGTHLGNSSVNFFSVGNRPGRKADQLRVFRRNGNACPRCRQTIERIIVAQRSSHICPNCQKLPP